MVKQACPKNLEQLLINQHAQSMKTCPCCAVKNSGHFLLVRLGVGTAINQKIVKKYLAKDPYLSLLER